MKNDEFKQTKPRISMNAGTNWFNMLSLPEVRKIVLRDRQMTVFWTDGTQNSSTASLNDTLDLDAGFGICLMKKLYGKKNGNRRLYRSILLRTIPVTDDDKLAYNDWKDGVLDNEREDRRRNKKNKNRIEVYHDR